MISGSLKDVYELPYSEYLDWCAIAIKEPNDAHTQAHHFGVLVSTLLAVNGNSKSDKTQYQAKDIFPLASRDLPDFYKTEEQILQEQEAENLKALEAYNRLFN